MNYPTPHGDKLRALAENNKLPASDRAGVDAAIEKYEAWTAENETIDSNLSNMAAGGGMTVRSKDHDFAVFRSLFIKTSHWKDFRESREKDTHLAYVAAEIKTNLDKTMFQEASATAHDLKLALPHSRYFLLCEWLDMEPVSTAVTAIEEVIVLRKAKRLSANVRQRFSTATGRVESRDAFEKHLAEHPFSPEAFRRFLDHVERLLDDGREDEQGILDRGWF